MRSVCWHCPLWTQRVWVWGSKLCIPGHFPTFFILPSRRDFSFMWTLRLVHGASEPLWRMGGEAGWSEAKLQSPDIYVVDPHANGKHVYKMTLSDETSGYASFTGIYISLDNNLSSKSTFQAQKTTSFSLWSTVMKMLTWLTDFKCPSCSPRCFDFSLFTIFYC